MARRWIFRGFAIALLVLSLCGWVWSGFCLDVIAYRTARGGVAVSTLYGEVRLSAGGGSYLVGHGWDHQRGWLSPVEFFPQYEGRSESFFLGVGYGEEDNVHDVIFPFWLPTISLAAILWLVWRKTRPIVEGRAFPVQSTTPSGSDEHIRRIRPQLAADFRFNDVELDTYSGFSRLGDCLRIAGRVPTEQDLAALHTFIDNTNPPVPVVWRVDVALSPRPSKSP